MDRIYEDLNTALKMIGATIEEYKATKTLSPPLLSCLALFMEKYRASKVEDLTELNNR